MPEAHEETLALLELTLCKGVSNRTAYALVERFGSARAALDAGGEELRSVGGIGPAVSEAIRTGPGRGAVEREMELMERYRTRLIPYFSDDYPLPLRHLDDGAPVLLRVRGEYLREDQLAIAIVGSRRCSTYGRRQARRFASALAGMGFTVVSGMAYGIDSEAHRAALAADGRTIAVLGEGLARTLSGNDAELALEIAQSGALASELPMETPARAGNFPPRNRLISGLSLGAVVVEAAKRSGSLITARHAGEQGRGVFAVPGPVDSTTSHGTHALIRDGAELVEDARDVVDGLGPLADALKLPPGQEAESPGDAEALTDPRELALNEREREVLAMLDSSPCHIDQVVADTDLAVSIVASTLLTLEIKGLVEKLDGQRYVRR